MKLNYRTDIDGLRAVAVLAVILNHVGVSFLPGGFIGVDVFFVISGYLITTIIMREIDANEFSLAKFYERRIRRIYPALFVVIFFTVLASAALYDVNNFRSFGKSVIATTFFLSNVHFWTETGYFDVSAQLKPLLHTWSLAVEEQFYIVFPALMFMLARYFKPKILHILTGMALVSFCWNVYVLQSGPSAAFYFAHLRAWELLIGSLLALTPFHKSSPTLRGALGLTGLGMIVAPVLLYSENTLFPGFAAAIPALGAALVIYSGIENFTIANRLLSLPPLVFTGQISYSLYLWHWPLVIFWKYYAIREITDLEMFALLSVILIISVLSWHFIERPFRSMNFLSRKKIFSYAAGSMALALTIGVSINFTEGFSKELTSQPGPEYTQNKNKAGDFLDCTGKYDDKGNLQLTPCKLGAAGQPPVFMVFGDSHAGSLSKAINDSAQRMHAAGVLTYAPGCPPLFRVSPAIGNEGIQCPGYVKAVFRYLEDHPEISTVIIICRFAMWAEGTYYKQEALEGQRELILADASRNQDASATNETLFNLGLDRTITKLLSLKRKIVIVAPIPEIGYDVPASYFIAARTGRDVNEIIAPTLGEYLSRNQKPFKALNFYREKYGIQILEPWKILCIKEKCLAVSNGHPLYKDDDHLSVFGSDLVSPVFDPLFKSMSR